MGREVRRVPLDFNWPINEIWEGFLNPHYKGEQCLTCNGNGFSSEANHLMDQWYGKAPFNPSETGNKPFSPHHSIIWARAKKNFEDYASCGPTEREAYRLANLFNARWACHLDANDVAALIEADRLWDFTRVARTPEQKKIAGGNSWLPESNGYVPSPLEVNEWEIGPGFGHDSINCYTVVKAKCERMNVPYKCQVCKGNGDIWESEELRKIYDEWKPTAPPYGEGWQFWETVTEGSPQSPVFATQDELINWLVKNEDYNRKYAKEFTDMGWAPSAIGYEPERNLTSAVRIQD